MNIENQLPEEHDFRYPARHTKNQVESCKILRAYSAAHGDIALDEKVAEVAEKTMQQWHHGKEMYPALLKTLLAIKREGVWPILTTLELMSDAVLSVTPYKYHGTVYGLTRNEWVALHCELECGNIFSNCESPDEDENDPRAATTSGN